MQSFYDFCRRHSSYTKVYKMHCSWIKSLKMLPALSLPSMALVTQLSIKDIKFTDKLKPSIIKHGYQHAQHIAKLAAQTWRMGKNSEWPWCHSPQSLTGMKSYNGLEGDPFAFPRVAGQNGIFADEREILMLGASERFAFQTITKWTVTWSHPWNGTLDLWGISFPFISALSHLWAKCALFKNALHYTDQGYVNQREQPAS